MAVLLESTSLVCKCISSIICSFWMGLVYKKILLAVCGYRYIIFDLEHGTFSIFHGPEPSLSRIDCTACPLEVRKTRGFFLSHLYRHSQHSHQGKPVQKRMWIDCSDDANAVYWTSNTKRISFLFFRAHTNNAPKELGASSVY